MGLERDEMIELLEQIAREGSDSNRIQAIKVLLRLKEGQSVDDFDLERAIAGS
jgi:hypothetical protein